jgi:beta-phosphoglucomutase-like phosphatase (HAD superfamily)
MLDTMLPTFRAITFDLDGVLADSEPWWNQIDTKLLAEHGVTYRGEYHRNVLGVSYRIAVEFYKNAFQVCASVEDLMRRRSEIATDFFAKHVGLFPSAKTTLEELVDMKIPLAIATSSVSASAHPFLERTGIRTLFEVVVTGDEVQRGKPHPDIYLRTSNKLGIPPEACLVIEDALTGVAAAKAANMRVAAIPDMRFMDPREYQQAADFVLESLSEIPDLIRRANATPSERHVVR